MNDACNYRLRIYIIIECVVESLGLHTYSFTWVVYIDTTLVSIYFCIIFLC